MFLFANGKINARDTRQIAQGHIHLLVDEGCGMSSVNQWEKEKWDLNRRGSDCEPSFEVYRFNKI